MKLKGTPERVVCCQKITFDIQADTLSLFELDNISDPHGALCCVREDPLNQFHQTSTGRGISVQNHMLSLTFLMELAEGDLGVDEVEAALRAVDGVVTQDEGAGYTCGC